MLGFFFGAPLLTLPAEASLVWFPRDVDGALAFAPPGLFVCVFPSARCARLRWELDGTAPSPAWPSSVPAEAPLAGPV